MAVWSIRKPVRQQAVPAAPSSLVAEGEFCTTEGRGLLCYLEMPPSHFDLPSYPTRMFTHMPPVLSGGIPPFCHNHMKINLPFCFTSGICLFYNGYMDATLESLLSEYEPRIAESYRDIVTSRFNAIRAALGSSFKNVHNDWTWARVYRLTVQPNVFHPT